jgi:ABC-type Fe3+-hydroxamate transport system substrate-binding protein
MLRFAMVMACALALAGCATISYLKTEYGSASPDKTVKLEDGTGFWVFLHKTRPKVIVSVDPETASGMGFAQGLTFGAAGGAPVYAAFDRAAQETLDEKQPGCRATNPRPLEKVYFEYDVVCPPPAPAAAAPVARKKR